MKTIRHDLRCNRITSIDSEEERCICPSRQYFGLHLTSKTGYRKLYFQDYEEMLAAAELLLRAGQGFEKRIDQYEVLGMSPNAQ